MSQSVGWGKSQSARINPTEADGADTKFQTQDLLKHPDTCRQHLSLTLGSCTNSADNRWEYIGKKI